MHTKETAYKTLVRPQLEYAALFGIRIQSVEKGHRTAARWTCKRWKSICNIGDMPDELAWPSLEAHREQSSLTLVHKMQSSSRFTPVQCLLKKIST